MTNKDPFATRRPMFHERDFESQAANVVYPRLADKATQVEMDEILKTKGKRLTDRRLLGTYERGSMSPLGGAMKPSTPSTRKK